MPGIVCVNDGRNCEELNADMEEPGVLSDESIRLDGKPNDDSPDRYGVRSKLAPEAVEHIRIAMTA